MLLIRDSTLKRAFLCSSCWALAPVLNEFIVSTAFGDVDYSSNVGQAPGIRKWRSIAVCWSVYRYLQHCNTMREGDPVKKFRFVLLALTARES